MENLKEAIDLAVTNPEYRYITRNGKMLNKFQGISGGQKSDPETSLIGRKEHISNIKASLKDLKEKLSKAEEDFLPGSPASGSRSCGAQKKTVPPVLLPSDRRSAGRQHSLWHGARDARESILLP